MNFTAYMLYSQVDLLGLDIYSEEEQVA